jgi:hypothetical protein
MRPHVPSTHYSTLSQKSHGKYRVAPTIFMHHIESAVGREYVLENLLKSAIDTAKVQRT